MQTLTLELSKLSLNLPLDQSGETLALTSLVLPRPAIRQRTTLKNFRLQKGKANFARKAFYEKALLKEKVDGRFSLTVQFTRPTAHPELQAWLQAMTGVGLETIGDALAGGLTLSALRPLLREPFDGLADQLTDDAPEFILHGGLDLDSETLKPGKISIPLQLTQSIRKSDLPPGPKSRDKRKTSAKTYKKGLTVGEAVVEVGVR